MKAKYSLRLSVSTVGRVTAKNELLDFHSEAGEKQNFLTKLKGK